MSADNRTHLLNTALELFASRGYDAVGVQEIVEAAGVTKPTLYHYFGSKRGLLEALLETHSVELLESLRQAADYRHDLTNSLRQVMQACFRFARCRPEFYRLLLTLRLSPPDSEAYQVAAGLARAQNEVLETLFQQAAQDHGNMRGRQRAYAATFLGMVNTCIILSFSGDAVLDEDLVTGRRTPTSDTALRPALELEQARRAAPHPDLPQAIARLARLRHASPALRYGDYRQLHVASEQLAFSRSVSGKTVVVALNASGESVAFDLPLPGRSGGALVDLLNPGDFIPFAAGQAPAVTVPPR